MKPKADELLHFLLWIADGLMRPTWRNLNDSYEAWAWRNGLGRRLSQFEDRHLIERHPDPGLDRVVRLTEEGRRLALGGRDPTERWSRPWDGEWRLVLFDLPTRRRALRMRLWRTLRQHHFGYLQNSVWVSPDPVDAIREVLDQAKVQAEVFLVVEGRPAGGESDADLVRAAWDFGLVDVRYAALARLLDRPLPAADRLAPWLRQERAAWSAALKADPLLPAGLCPPDYAGPGIFHRRKEVLGQLADRLR